MTKNGFTLIEIAVVLAIIAVLAGVLTPMVGNYIGEARQTRAASETQSIASAILNFNKDTGKWPIFSPPLGTITSTSAIYIVLNGPGVYPLCSSPCNTAEWGSSNKGDLGAILERNSPGYGVSGKFAWRGPYATNIGTDPWGHPYIVNASSLGFGIKKGAFVLSAGPNEIIDTAFDQSNASGATLPVTAGGDDIIARIR